MINVFVLQNGRLNQVNIESRNDLENAAPVWVDLTDPNDDERAWVKSIYGVTLPGEDEVKDIEASLRFYVEGLAFKITRQLNPGGRIRWCWLERDGVAIMLQEYWKDGPPGGWPTGVLGQGVSICFVCADAIAVYHD